MAGFSEAKKKTQYNFSSYITAYALRLHFQNTRLNAALGYGRIYCVGHNEHTNTHCDKATQLFNIKAGTCVVTTGLSRIKFFNHSWFDYLYKKQQPRRQDNIIALKVTQNLITS